MRWSDTSLGQLSCEVAPRVLWGRRSARGWRPASSSRPSPPSAYRLALRAWVAACLAPRVAWLAPRVAGPRAGAQPGGEENRFTHYRLGNTLTVSLRGRSSRGACGGWPHLPVGFQDRHQQPRLPAQRAEGPSPVTLRQPTSRRTPPGRVPSLGGRTRAWPEDGGAVTRLGCHRHPLFGGDVFRSRVGSRPPRPSARARGARPTCRDGTRACGRDPRPARLTPGRSAGWQTRQPT